MSSVKPFLRNLFRDENIVRFPFFQELFAWFMSTMAAKNSSHRYSLIGGRSPLGEITNRQASLLNKELSDRNINNIVEIAMRYWSPFTSEAVLNLKEAKVNKVIALSLYPHYSKATTESSVKELKRVMHNFDYKPELIIIDTLYNHDKYIELLSNTILSALNLQTILFTAHSLPESFIEEGDPYLEQVNKTVDAVMEKVGDFDYYLSFQSKSGRGKWLGPSSEEMVRNLGVMNESSLLVVPLSFVSDNIETRWELDIHLKGIAKNSGIENFVRSPVFNDDRDFISFLADLVEENLKENIQ